MGIFKNNSITTKCLNTSINQKQSTVLYHFAAAHNYNLSTLSVFKSIVTVLVRKLAAFCLREWRTNSGLNTCVNNTWMSAMTIDYQCETNWLVINNQKLYLVMFDDKILTVSRKHLTQDSMAKNSESQLLTNTETTSVWML